MNEEEREGKKMRRVEERRRRRRWGSRKRRRERRSDECWSLIFFFDCCRFGFSYWFCCWFFSGLACAAQMKTKHSAQTNQPQPLSLGAPPRRHRVRGDPLRPGRGLVGLQQAPRLQLPGGDGEGRHGTGHEGALQRRPEGIHTVVRPSVRLRAHPLTATLPPCPGPGLPDHPPGAGRDLLLELRHPGPRRAHHQPGPRQH